jgi:hypothetical protein
MEADNPTSDDEHLDLVDSDEPDQMAMIGEVERLGRAVQQGAVARTDAIAELMSSAGLTEVGAADLLDGWARGPYGYERRDRTRPGPIVGEIKSGFGFRHEN